MKKLILILAFCFSNIFLLAQSSNIGLLFTNNGDLLNPSFFIIPDDGKINSLLFEVHEDSTSNILLSDYSVENDSFLTPIYLTHDNYKNINPAGIWLGNEKIIFYQTNILGKWNIAYCEYLNGAWANTKIIADSNFDDISPSAINYNYTYGNWSYLDKALFPAGIVYQKGNSIYLFTKNDSVEINKILIDGTDSLKYSSPAAMYDYSGNGPAIRVAAIQTDKLGNHRIIEKIISLNNNSDTTFVVDDGNVDNPRFLPSYIAGLSYNKTENSQSSVYTFNTSANKLILNDTLSGNFTNIQAEKFESHLIFKAGKLDKLYLSPYVYNYQSNENNYIGISFHAYSLKDTLIHTSVYNSKAAIELIGYNLQLSKNVNYTVWEDSVKGNIKLLGRKVFTPTPNDVKEESQVRYCTLFQNYPNPFNPSTTITYEIPKSGLVQLKIYDLLGREIAVLVNENQMAGKHSVVFDTQKTNKLVASGIYFYRLNFGSSALNRKMIMLK